MMAWKMGIFMMVGKKLYDCPKYYLKFNFDKSQKAPRTTSATRDILNFVKESPHEKTVSTTVVAKLSKFYSESVVARRALDKAGAPG